MKSIFLKLSLTMLFGILSYSLLAQATQTITYGEIKNYSVDTEAPDDPLNGTPGSTYTWSIFNDTPADITGTTMTITNQAGSTSGNRVTIDWGTTPVGTYTLHVVETNNNCTGTEKFINVIIEDATPGMPDLTGSSDICSTESAFFDITNAPANSTITFTVIGGTAVVASPITVGGDGNATIEVTHDGISGQIVVTLTEMTLENGTSVDIDPDVMATTNVTIIETSDITFD